jgi:hypothetical protein
VSALDDLIDVRDDIDRSLVDEPARWFATAATSATGSTPKSTICVASAARASR